MSLPTIRSNPAYSGNYTRGRYGYSPEFVVLHHGYTTNFDTIGATFKNPSVGTSAHYGVAEGRIDRYVDESNCAWHATSGNTKGIGIECTNSSIDYPYPVSDGTIDTAIELITDIHRRYGWKKCELYRTLYPHKHFNATACPGDYLMGKLQFICDNVNERLGGGVATKEVNVQLWGANGTPAQQWIRYDYTDKKTKKYSYSRFKNVASGKWLDVAGGVYKNGSNVQVYPSNNTPAQKFIMEAKHLAFHTRCVIKSFGNPSFVLDVEGNVKQSGRNVALYKRNNTTAQWWTLVFSHIDKNSKRNVYYICSHGDQGAQMECLDVVGGGK